MLEKERRTSSLVVKTLEDDIQRKFVEHSRIEQERLVHRSNAGDDSGLESNTLKLKVKIRDEILGVYQNALVKLLKDETAEFGIENGFGIKVFCPMVMKETLQITFRAYDQEIQILLDELNNLHSDLRTARLYNAEVRKQFELQMKSIYR